MYNEAIIDNALIGQKDAIWGMIGESRYEEALSALAFISSMWEACSYGYKIVELCNVVKRDATNWEFVNRADRLLRIHQSLVS